MPFTRAAPMAMLPPGSMLETSAAGRAVAVCNVDGELFAVDGTCPHRGGPLAQGALHGHTIVCPWHAWEYDCRTGEMNFNPAVKLATYAVKAEGGDILVDSGG